MKDAEPASTGRLKSAMTTVCPDATGCVEAAAETVKMLTASTSTPAKSIADAREKRKSFRGNVGDFPLFFAYEAAYL